MDNPKRPFSYPMYLIALLITAVIFAIGVYVGTILDRGSLDNLSLDVSQSIQRLESAQLLFFLDESASFCPVYADELEKLEADTNRIGQKLNLLEDKGAVDLGLKKQYFSLEAQSYLLSKKVKEKCATRDVLVLYFYSNTECAQCRNQGEELEAVRDETLVKSANAYHIRLYSFDGDIGSPVAEALKEKYDVSRYPSIVVNDQVYEGYQDQEALRRIFQ